MHNLLGGGDSRRQAIFIYSFLHRTIRNNSLRKNIRPSNAPRKIFFPDLTAEFRYPRKQIPINRTEKYIIHGRVFFIQLRKFQCAAVCKCFAYRGAYSYLPVKTAKRKLYCSLPTSSVSRRRQIFSDDCLSDHL